MTEDGTLDKETVANITEGIAQSYVVENFDQMRGLIEKATNSDDLLIVLGRFRNDDGRPFEIVTQARLAELLGVAEAECPPGVVEYKGQRVAARLAAGIEPSPWILFDADNPTGMPSDWAAKNIQARLEMLEPIVPGVSTTGRLEWRSSTPRVVKNGGDSKHAAHALMRVSDAGKIALLKAHVHVEVVNAGISFKYEKKSRADRSKTVGIENRSVFDFSVWNPGRLIFTAKPDISGAPGYRLDDAGIVIVSGADVLDLSRIKKPNPAALREYRERTGVGLHLKVNESGGLSVTSYDELTRDTEIEVKGVVRPLHEWIASMKPGDKLRCEAPFRESSSEAAFIRIGNDGEPFIHDVGNSTTYRLVPAAEDIIAEFNGRYMVVNEAGRALVYEPAYDPVLKKRHYIPITFEDFKKLQLNRQIVVGYKANGEPKRIDAGAFWLSHRSRRQYVGGIVFDPANRSDRPDVLNLWQGFAVEPRPGGSWKKLSNHLLTNICGGNREYLDYLIGWLARLFQYPAEQGEVAVVLRGPEGTGKGTLAKAIFRLLGVHAIPVTNAEHLVGRFNGHLRDIIFLFSDEAFYAGNKAHVSVLKSMITEPRLIIEGKHKNAVEAANCIHLLMASNEAWVIPAAIDSRRFCVFDVSPDQANDHDYFAAIWAELEDGGYEAMLHDLLHHDLTGFNVRRVPRTAALNEQRVRSLRSEQAWWRDCLHSGAVGNQSEWTDFMTTTELHHAYCSYARDRHEYKLLDQSLLGAFLISMGGLPGRPAVGNPGRRRGYRFGTLEQARAAFIAKTKLDPDWPE